MASHGIYRKCDLCHKVYNRSNRIRVWTVRNFGHRDGWVKMDLKVCNRCMDDKQAQRMLSVASIRIVKKATG